MRVAVFGYQTWGYETLRTLISSRHEVSLVVTHPVSQHAYESIWCDSVEDLARDHGLPVYLAKRPNEELLAQVKAAEPDIIVANNWRTRLPREIFAYPPNGTLNLHDSLLPEFTGFSPVAWALISGASKTGVTAHRMDDTLDTGDIVGQKSIAIGPHDTAAELVKATIDLIPKLLLDSLDRIEMGTATWTPQKSEKRTFFHKRTEADSLIDWSWQAEDIERMVRAMADPYPNAFTYHKGQRIRVTRAHVSAGLYGGTPGRIFIHEGSGMVIVAGRDAFRGASHGLVIDQIRTDDGAEHSASEFFPVGGGYLTMETV